jgi:hypothetical protein
MDTTYEITSYWGGLDGSIMFWVLLLSVFGTVAVATNRERHRELIPWVVAIISAVEMFFIFIMVVHNNPFDTFAKPTYDALTAPHWLLDLPQAGHLTPTNVCELIDSVGFVAKAFGGREASDGCGNAYTSRQALDAVAGAALPFFDLYLNGDRAAEEPLRIAVNSIERGPRDAKRHDQAAAAEQDLPTELSADALADQPF